MKQLISMMVAVMVTCLVTMFGTMSFMVYHEAKVVEALNDEWREAAAPVFKARNVPTVGSTATPYNLKRALDGTSVMTRHETYKWRPDWEGKNGETRIIIASADQDWVRQK